MRFQNYCVLRQISLISVFVNNYVIANDVFVVGYNDYGQLGVGDFLQRSTQTLLGASLPLTITKGAAAGLYHNLAFGEARDEGSILYSWGRNTKGQLGLGTVVSHWTPNLVSWISCPTPSSWTCSPNFCDETCQGRCDSFGQTNTFWKESDMHCMKPQDRLWSSDRDVPVIVQVAAGEDSSFVLTDDGKVFSWGSNDWGQIGITDFEEEQLERPDGKWIRDIPQLVRTFVRLNVKIVKIAAGSYHVLALDDSGQVWTWGSNSEGQLGVGDLSQRNQPVQITFFSQINVVQIAAGAYHSLFLSEMAAVYASGLNDDGQLGQGDTVPRLTPAVITSLLGKNISGIATGDYSSYAISDLGEVFSWGSNTYSQLGQDNANFSVSIVPKRLDVLVKAGAVIYQIFGGQRNAFALDQSGDVYAIGNNDFGMLGLGDETQRTVPTLIPALVGDNIFSIASGAYHTVAVSGCWQLARPCSGHGICDLSGKCSCDVGYDGYRCDSVCPGGTGNKCNLNGDCVVPQSGEPYCICYAGYTSSDCSKQCPGGASNVCSGNGICLSDGSCLCESGWSGIKCSQRCPGAMSSPCSDLGICVDGICSCFIGFTGRNCSTECNGGAYNPCSYHGSCQFDGSCVCDPGFRQRDCSCECPGGANNECNGRGECGDLCGCTCRFGYRGKNCSLNCPGSIAGFLDGKSVLLHVCSGHGECDANAQCICYEDWSGDICSSGPFDWTWYIVAGSFGTFFLCVGLYLLNRYRNQRLKLADRKRKRAARKKLRGKKDKKKSKKKGGGRLSSTGQDRSKMKGKENK
jgi:alpha-tubulin suppressor-like RCC1 family protein